jgi:mono/diheme cytochrome c family protein
MSHTANYAGPISLALLLGLGQAACSPKESRPDDAAPAPMDSTAAATDTTPAPGSDTLSATPSMNPAPSQTVRDTPPAGAANPAGKPGGGGSPKLSSQEYDGWRQYSVHCARCHGQDVLPNPVAANLLISLGPGGPIDSPEKFAEIVSAGRPASGMPAFKGVLTAQQIKAIYEYVKGRAEKRIPPGRPASPAG